MVDDADQAHKFAVHEDSILGDNEFFQRMMGLIPQNIFLQDQSTDESSQAPESLQMTEGESKKNKKTKHKEKKKKKKLEAQTDNTADAASGSSKETVQHREETADGHQKNKKQKNKQKKKKNKRENPFASDDTGATTNNTYTDIKAKKQKVENTAKKQKVGNTEENQSESSIPSSAPSTSLTTPMTGSHQSLLSTSMANMEDKRARLRAKIEELQAKRKLNDKEMLDKKRLKRQESKMKLKQRRKKEKLMKNKPHLVNGGDSTKGSNPVNKTPTKPVYNKEGQIVFSKFDFTDSGKKDKKASDLSGKDYKRLLEKIEKRNEKIKKVKSKDEGAAKSLQDKFKWESVLNKAEGQKVKDNPELLKKALKKKEKIREQKKKKWDDRSNQVKKQQDARQKKRNENIQKRKQSNKDNKMQKAKKKGRILPGF